MKDPAPRLDLRPDHWAIVRDVLQLHVPDREVLAFGSRATWTAKNHSDLDLAILGNKPLPLNAASALAEGFGESDLPFKIDLVDWARVDEAFRDIIRRDGVAVQVPGRRTERKESVVASDDWPMATFGEFAPFSYGKGLRKDMRNPAGHIPVFGSNGHVGWHDKALTNGPTVIVGRKGTVGAVHYSPVPCWPIDTTFFISGGDAELVRFRYYALNTLGVEAMNADSAVPGLNREATHVRELQVPPLPEQRAIAHILGTLDDKIELNRRMNETLEAMARALFKSWFVDFDPVRAKMEGREPGLPPHITALFPDRLVDSELGELPEGWKVRPLTDLLAINPERRLQKGDSAPYLDMANMPTKGHVPDNAVNRPFGSGMRFMNGDTLVARITPCLQNGKTAFVDFLQNGQIAWSSTEYIVLRPKSPLPNEFAYCLARSQKFRDFAIQSMTGISGRQRVPANALRQLFLACPTKPVADAFRDHVRPLMAQASVATRESSSLADLRDALLPKLISGDIRVRDAGRVAGETV